MSNRRQKRLFAKADRKNTETFFVVMAILKWHDTLDKMAELYLRLKDPLPAVMHFNTRDNLKLPLTRHGIKGLRTRLEIKMAELTQGQDAEKQKEELSDLLGNSAINVAGGLSRNKESDGRGVSGEAEQAS